MNDPRAAKPATFGDVSAQTTTMPVDASISLASAAVPDRQSSNRDRSSAFPSSEPQSYVQLVGEAGDPPCPPLGTPLSIASIPEHAHTSVRNSLLRRCGADIIARGAVNRVTVSLLHHSHYYLAFIRSFCWIYVVIP